MGSRSRDRGGGECWGPGGRTFVTPLRYTNCSLVPAEVKKDLYYRENPHDVMTNTLETISCIRTKGYPTGWWEPLLWDLFSKWGGATRGIACSAVNRHAETAMNTQTCTDCCELPDHIALTTTNQGATAPYMGDTNMSTV